MIHDPVVSSDPHGIVSSADTFERVVRYLPKGLFSDRSVALLRSMTGRVPDPLADSFALECRLSEEDDVDLTVSGRRLTADRMHSIERSTGEMTEVAHIVQRTDEVMSRAPSGIEALHVEYDARDADGGQGSPGLYIQFALGEDFDSPDTLRLAVEALHPDISSGVRCARIRDVLEALPPGAVLRHLGAFSSRPGNTTRLSIAGLDIDATPALLERIRWAGDPAPMFERVVDVNSWQPGRLGCLQLDVAEDVGGRLGFEFAVNGRTDFGWELDAIPFLAGMVEQGLCISGKQRELLHWPGLTMERLPHRGGHQVMLRTVNHLKLVLDPDERAKLKAYLFVFCPWGQTLDHRQLKAPQVPR